MLYLLENLLKLRHRRDRDRDTRASFVTLNTLDRDGRPQFIHSGTYEELIEAFGLTPAHIAAAVASALDRGGQS